MWADRDSAVSGAAVDAIRLLVQSKSKPIMELLHSAPGQPSELLRLATHHLRDPSFAARVKLHDLIMLLS